MKSFLNVIFSTRGRPKCCYATALKLSGASADWPQLVDLCTFCSAIRTRADDDSKLPLSALLLLKRKKKEKVFCFESQPSEMVLSLQCSVHGSSQIRIHSHCLLDIFATLSFNRLFGKKRKKNISK